MQNSTKFFIICVFYYYLNYAKIVNFILNFAQMRKRLINIAIFAAALLSMTGCDSFRRDPAVEKYSQVMIVYSVGRNSLHADLEEDIDQLAEGFVPEWDSDKALLVVSHSVDESGSYVNETSPYLIRICKDGISRVVRDTVKAFDPSMILTRPSDMTSVLEYVREVFPSDNYGMVFSSHGWGWLPAGYYNKPGAYSALTDRKSYISRRHDQAVPFEGDPDDGGPRVKSVGQENVSEGGAVYSYELDIDKLAEAIPYRLSYLIFDACLMGGVETAFELKDKCDYVVASQAEVLAAGFDYENMAERLLAGDKPDVAQVARDFYEKYCHNTGTRQTATVSMVDCKRIGVLADVCRGLFEKYRASMNAVNPAYVQRYFRYNRHWFYDLESILVQAGIADADLKALRAALDDCIVYKASTPYILNEIKVNTFSGFSMYLPCNGDSYLNTFYKTLAWNKATELVK